MKTSDWRTVLAVVAASAGLAACATPKVQAIGSGVGPDMAARPSFALSAVPAADGPPSALVPLVEARLEALGLSRVDKSPRYLVDIGFSQRPLGVGAFARQAATPQGEQPDWLAAPQRRRFWQSGSSRLCALSVRFTDAQSGQAAYQAQAAVRRPDGDCEKAAPDLVQAALVQIPLPPTKAAG